MGDNGWMSVCTDWFDLDDLDCDASSPAASGLVNQGIDWLYRVTMGRYSGECESAVRPVPSCGHIGRCRCATRWDHIDLTRWVVGPINALTSVTVGAVEYTDLDEVARIDNSRYLTPIEGGPLDPWPPQRANRNIGADETWVVEISHGEGPPPSLLEAAKDFCCQLAKQANGHECDLPDGITSVSDNGVTLQLSIAEGGMTGIPRIDSVLGLHGARLRRRRMFSPRSSPAIVRGV